jgi:hypothetical protein
VKTLLQEFINEIVNISPEYMKKERVREAIQNVITSMVSKGEIQNAQELENFFSSADMSLRALKMVPFETFTKISKK